MDQIAQHCQCQYNSSLIVDYQFVCTTTDYDVVFQAELLPTENRTALEIRNTIQQWVLSNPFITINNISYQVDSKCSTEVKELGVTSCTAQPDHSLSLIIIISIPVTVAAVGVLCIVLITYCIWKKKSTKTHKMR